MNSDTGRSASGSQDERADGQPPEDGSVMNTIEPDISRAPPPPAWKDIALPKPLPGSLPRTPTGGKIKATPSWELYGLATEFIVFILVFTGIGWVIAHYTGTGQITIAIAAVAGILLGGWRLIRGATQVMNRK